jgi:hypothetical protein
MARPAGSSIQSKRTRVALLGRRLSETSQSGACDGLDPLSLPLRDGISVCQKRLLFRGGTLGIVARRASSTAPQTLSRGRREIGLAAIVREPSVKPDAHRRVAEGGSRRPAQTPCDGLKPAGALRKRPRRRPTQQRLVALRPRRVDHRVGTTRTRQLPAQRLLLWLPFGSRPASPRDDSFAVGEADPLPALIQSVSCRTGRAQHAALATRCHTHCRDRLTDAPSRPPGPLYRRNPDRNSTIPCR